MALYNKSATHNYLDEEDAEHCDEKETSNRPHIKVANGNILTPFAQATARLSSNLSKKAQHA